MFRVARLLCLGASMFLLTTCGGPDPASVQVREQDGDRTVELRRNDRLDII